MRSGNDVTTGPAIGKSFVPARGLQRLSVALLLAGIWLPAPCSAEPMTGRTLLEDTKLYFSAPLRWDKQDWLCFGETMVAIGVAHEYDGNVRAHFSNGSAETLDGKDPNSLRDAAPAAAIVVGTWAIAALLDDADGYEEGREMLESAGLTAISTTFFKFAAGRKRPNETTHVDDWSRSGDSFPSMHTSLAFAIGTVLAESGGDNFRWVRRAVGYGMAGATAYARMHDHQHWLSDTIAGAAVGIVTARFVMNRGEARAERSAFMLVPTDGGVLLAYRVNLR